MPSASRIPEKGDLRPNRIQLDALFGETFALYRHTWHLLITMMLLAFVGEVVAWVVSGAIGWMIGYFQIPLLTWATWTLFHSVISTTVWVGTSILLLNLARGREVSLRQFLFPFSYLLRALAAGFLFTFLMNIVCVSVPFGVAYLMSDVMDPVPLFLLSSLILLLSFLAGIVLSLGLGQFHWLIIDRGLGPIRALTTSWQITRGNKWYLFVLLLAACCLAGMGPLGLSFTRSSLPGRLQISALLLWVYLLVVVAAPYFWLLWCLAYLKMSRHSNAVELPTKAGTAVGWWRSLGISLGICVLFGGGFVSLPWVPWQIVPLGTPTMEIGERRPVKDNIPTSTPTRSLPASQKVNNVQSKQVSSPVSSNTKKQAKPTNDNHQGQPVRVPVKSQLESKPVTEKRAPSNLELTASIKSGDAIPAFQWVEVLPWIDIAAGTPTSWILDGDNLVAPLGNGGKSIEIPINFTRSSTEGCYQIETEVTVSDKSVVFVLPVVDNRVNLSVRPDEWQLQWVKDGESNHRFSKDVFEYGKRVRLTITVKTSSTFTQIIISVDGRRAAYWSGVSTTLKGWGGEKACPPKLGGWDNQPTFHSVKFRPINGKAIRR